MSHGVTENTAGLTYSGESGGLNEATSDIFGTMVEFYAANANDPGDYLIGEEFDLAQHAGFRRMDNPIADGSSPNCWSTNTKNLDVHYSSGVGNHFYYLLAEGSGAKTINGVAHSSPTCNGSTVTGIGRDAAQRIWFRALTVYMTSGTTYAQARTATLNAATRPVRRRLHAAEHRGSRLERGQRELTRRSWGDRGCLDGNGQSRVVPQGNLGDRRGARTARWCGPLRTTAQPSAVCSRTCLTVVAPVPSRSSSRCAESAAQPASVRNVRPTSSWASTHVTTRVNRSAPSCRLPPAAAGTRVRARARRVPP